MVKAFTDLDRDRIVLESDWSDKERIKEVPGASWDAKNYRWTLPLSWSSCVILRGVFGQDLVLDESLKGWAGAERVLRIDPAMALRDHTSAPEHLYNGLYAKLYPFQRAGVAFLDAAGSAILGDDMGTGKTIQLLFTLQNKFAGLEPALVICPNSMKGTWKREAEIWYPSCTPYVVAGGAVARRKILDKAAADPSALVIINFESVRLHSRTAGFGSISLKRCAACGGTDPKTTETNCEAHARELNKIPFAAVIADEAHRLRDPNAKQTRACWAVAHGPSVRHRFAATGTIVEKGPENVWSIGHFVAPDDFPRKSKFVDRYCQPVFNASGFMTTGGLNPATKAEFFKFFDPRYRRMNKDRVLAQLPPKVRTTRYVQMTPQQLKVYEKIADGVPVTRLESGALMVVHADIAANTRLLQFSSAYMEHTGTKLDPKTGEYVDQYEMRDPSPKIDAMMELIEEMEGRSLAVCAVHSQLIDLAEKRLLKAGISYGKITGDVKQWERDLYLKKFQDGELQVMLFTMAAGGVGLTMTAADTILFLQRSWENILNLQSENRVHRIGSEKHQQVTIIDLVTEGSIEEGQIEKLQVKLAKLEEIQRDKAAPGADITTLEAQEKELLNV